MEYKMVSEVHNTFCSGVPLYSWVEKQLNCAKWKAPFCWFSSSQSSCVLLQLLNCIR